AVRRAIRLRENSAAPRVSDLVYIPASTAGKIELESVEEGREPRIIEDLSKRAILNTFNHYFNVHELDELVRRFDEGLTVDTGDLVPARSYVGWANDLPGVNEAVKRLEVGEMPAPVASAVEFILEGLHLNRRLNKDRHEGGFRYRG
ncbi:MAG: magnesium chelatase, partial [Chloroflexi bacterium]|nr:magnesium chelatase [Chloroflexota bacterium]